MRKKIMQKKQRERIVLLLNLLNKTKVWEAAFILCAQLLLHSPVPLETSSVLELGSGVGLVGLLIAKLKQQSATSRGDVFLTDFDSRVLVNLQESIHRQFAECILHKHEEIVHSGFCTHVCALDWEEFAPSRPEIREEIASLRCDLIVGSALCYSPSHAILSETIR